MFSIDIIVKIKNADKFLFQFFFFWGGWERRKACKTFHLIWFLAPIAFLHEMHSQIKLMNLSAKITVKL